MKIVFKDKLVSMCHRGSHQETADLVIYIICLLCNLFSVGLRNAAEIETEDGVRLSLSGFQVKCKIFYRCLYFHYT